MSSTRLVYMVVGLSMLGWVGYSLLQPTGFQLVVSESTSEVSHADKILAAEDGQDEQLVDEVRNLRQTVSLLKSQVASLETRLQVRQEAQPLAAPAAEHVSDTTEQTTSPPEDELDETVLAEREQGYWEEYLGLIEAGLQHEHVDRQWSSKAKTEIENAFTNKALAGAAVTNIECRTSLCRIEVVHEDPQSLAEFDVLLAQKLTHILPQAVMDRIELEDGSISTFVYMSRDGYELPQPDERR